MILRHFGLEGMDLHASQAATGRCRSDRPRRRTGYALRLRHPSRARTTVRSGLTCFRRIAADRPAGSAPTIPTSNSMLSRVSWLMSDDFLSNSVQIAPDQKQGCSRASKCHPLAFARSGEPARPQPLSNHSLRHKIHQAPGKNRTEVCGKYDPESAVWSHMRETDLKITTLLDAAWPGDDRVRMGLFEIAACEGASLANRPPKPRLQVV